MRNQTLIKSFYDCAAACFTCADACLDESDVKKMVPCIRLDKVCAATCIATAQSLAVDLSKEDVRGLVQYCKEICQKCGEECAKHEAQHCKDCAKACKDCVEACERFLA